MINRNSKQKTISNAGKVVMGFCAGAAVAGVAAMIKVKNLKDTVKHHEEYIEDLYINKSKSDNSVKMLSDEVKNLRHEIDIRDCMVMEGIDGDANIYMRRMQHFRDYKIQTSDIGQEQECSRDICFDSAVDAKEAYNDYIKSLSKFKSEVPVITEDDELPF